MARSADAQFIQFDVDRLPTGLIALDRLRQSGSEIGFSRHGSSVTPSRSATNFRLVFANVCWVGGKKTAAAASSSGRGQSVRSSMRTANRGCCRVLVVIRSKQPFGQRVGYVDIDIRSGRRQRTDRSDRCAWLMVGKEPSAAPRRVGARLSDCLRAAVGDHADVVHAQHLGQVLNQFAEGGQLLLDVLWRLIWREVAQSARQGDVGADAS
jgi:hypothetical protein